MTNGAALREIRMTVGGTRCFGRHGAPPGLGAHDERVPVVLVHGFGMSGSYLLPTARLLVRRRPVWVPDLPGHGRSATPRRALDVAGLADALLGWLDAVGVGRAVLLGNSMGCQVVAEAARRRPELAESLVFVGPTFDPRYPTVAALVFRVLRDAPLERPSLIPVVVRDYLRMGPRRLWREFTAMRAHRMRELLPALDAPTLVVRGGRDTLTSPAWCAEVARLAGGGPMATVPGAGHAVNFSAPAALADLVDGFLRSRAGDPPAAIRVR